MRDVKTKIKELKQCARLLNIEVPADVVSSKFDEVYKEIRKAASIPGFRVGKAPYEMIKSRYAALAKEEVLKQLIPDSYIKAIEETALIPVEPPEITDVKFEEEKLLSFSAKVEVRPKVNIKRYKGLQVKKEKIETSDEEIREVLNSLRERYAEFTPVSGRACAEGDFVIADIEINEGGKKLEKQEKAWFEVKKEAGKPGLTENFIGMNAGETKSFNFTLGNDIEEKEHAGKEAAFDVKLHEIKAKKLPALDDEFAKSLGTCKTLAELESRLRDDLRSRKEQASQAKMENEILDQLLAANGFDIPPALVKRELARLIKDAKIKLLYQGYKEEDVDKQQKLFEGRLAPEAERLVRIYFILDSIATQEKIEASDAELDAEIATIAARSHQKPDEVRGYLNKNNLLENVKYELREKKAVKFLVENAAIKE